MGWSMCCAFNPCQKETLFFLAVFMAVLFKIYNQKPSIRESFKLLLDSHHPLQIKFKLWVFDTNCEIFEPLDSPYVSSLSQVNT